METVAAFADLFSNWPDGLPRRGVLVVSFGEQIPFDGFLTSETLLFVNRRNPDSMGTRQLLLSYDSILAVKIADVVKPKVFASYGFQGEVPKR